MLKALITHGEIETTVPKAKALKREADKMITLAKENSLAAKRRAVAKLMVRHNPLTAKEARRCKKDKDTSCYNDDRLILQKLFGELGPRFATREGGYTRIVRNTNRVGDNSESCIIQYLQD
jgi:large subunit ribosomal protein L17